MAFHGDLSTFPLPELLQWLDSSRKTGALQLSWDGGHRKLFLLSGEVVAVSGDGLWDRVARMLAISKLARGEMVLSAFQDARRAGEVLEHSFRAKGVDPAWGAQLAREDLLGTTADLTVDQSGTFHWSEDPDRFDDEWIAVSMTLRELLFECLRWVDEQGDVDQTLPSDQLLVRSLVKPSAQQTVFQRIILTLCEKGQNLGRLRLALGVSRTTTTRRVYDLMRLKWVKVEGAAEVQIDPVSDMLEKGAVLIRERQFEAAGLIFSALLASDPSDRRVREFARVVEREHVAALYSEMPPVLVPQILDNPEALSLLRPEERHIASLVNGNWDVSTIVLASQSRELETLKCLHKLRRLGLLHASAHSAIKGEVME